MKFKKLIIILTINMTATDRMFGKVKWFNRRYGFGYITTLTGSSNVRESVFASHTEIKTSGEASHNVAVWEELPTYLVAGEYVKFDIETGDDGRREAINITAGYDDERLMCELMREEPKKYYSPLKCDTVCKGFWLMTIAYLAKK